MSALIPEQLYRPTSKDLTTDFTPGQFFFTETLAQAAGTIESGFGSDTDLNIPADRVLVLTRLYLDAQGGGAQLAVALVFQLRDGAPNNVLATFGGAVPNAGAGLARHVLEVDLAQGYPIFAKQSIFALAAFSAAAAVNTIRFSAFGFLIPRGNWQPR